MNDLFEDFNENIYIPYRSAKSQYKEIKSKITELKNSIASVEEQIELRRKAVKVIEYLIGRKYDKVIELFEGTVTSSLVDLFDEKYQFKFLIGKRGDSTICDFTVCTGKYDEFLDIRMTQGTSLKNIIGVIMRLVIAKLDKKMPKFILLDEPFGGVEVFRQEIAAKFLSRICKVFHLQLLVVTQSPEFAECSDNVIDLRRIAK